MKTTSYIIEGKTKMTSGKFLVDVNSAGLMASWSSDKSLAARLTCDEAARRVKNMVSLIPNSAALVEAETPAKETLYATAKATVSCSQFKAGEFVSVRFFHFGDNGEAWYLISRSQNGPLANEVAYPASHLTQFCL